MASYSYKVAGQEQITPTLKKGWITLFASEPVYFAVGENPTVDINKCAVLQAKTTRRIKLPVKCTKIAFRAVHNEAVITLVEEGGVSSSCSKQ